MSADVADAIARILNAERQRALDLDDPVVTLRNTEDLGRHVLACLEELQAESPRAVRALRRRGWSFAQIGGETGLSNRRVAELARA